jgi:hypothetical protein
MKHIEDMKMNRRFFLLTMALATIAGLAPRVYAADDPPVYGSQLMTQQERLEYRDRMRNAASAEEREQIRKEHHERMKVRAREQGVKLPDEPPAQGGGKGMGPGGAGMGQGGGMGGGMNKGNR